MMMQSNMRAAVIDYHKGKEELCSMDDELPVLIYVILFTGIPNVFTELQIIEDYVSMDSTYEAELRFITNLRVNFFFSFSFFKIDFCLFVLGFL